MANKKSNNLYLYLEQKGVLREGNEAEIIKAKKEYTKQYKAKWKREQSRDRKEIRFLITKKEHLLLETISKELEMNPTTFIRKNILAELYKKTFIPNKDKLLKILQLVSMAYSKFYRKSTHTTFENQDIQDAEQYLSEAEMLLISYIQNEKKV